MSFLFYWFKSKKAANSNTKFKKEAKTEPIEEEVKISTKIALEEKVEIRKNTIWDLLSDFSIFIESPEVTKAEKDKENMPTFYFKKEENEQLAKPLIVFLFEEIQKYRNQIYSLYLQHSMVEKRIASALPYFSSIEQIILEVEVMISGSSETITNLTNLIKDLTQLITLSLEAKERLSIKHSRTKYSAIGASALGVIIGVVFPYIAVGGVAISMLSGGAMFRKNNKELKSLVAYEELITKLLGILLEKKDKFEITIDHFVELKECLKTLFGASEFERAKAIERLNQLVPLRVLKILSQKKQIDYIL